MTEQFELDTTHVRMRGVMTESGITVLFPMRSTLIFWITIMI